MRRLTLAALAAAFAVVPAAAQDSSGPILPGADPQTFSESVELIDPNNLRVCADPASLPFSNDKLEGFENRIADLLGEKLGKPVTYSWFPMATGFVRKTLGEMRCDVIIGSAQGDELVQTTNPYYRTSYVMVYPPDGKAAGITQLSDPRLKSLKIGVVAGTPPGTNIAMNGLMGTVKPYQLMVDTRHTPVPEMMINDLKTGVIDVAVMWGPIGGYYAKIQEPDYTVVSLAGETGGSRMTYRITMGVRASDQNWKRELNTLIRRNQKEINAILIEFGVPLLDEKDQPITN